LLISGAYASLPRGENASSRVPALIGQIGIGLLWVVAIVATVANVAHPMTLAGVALAACVAQSFNAVSGRLRASRSALAARVADTARAQAEIAFLQAADEIRRLRIDVKTTADVHQQLSAALDDTTSELNLSRSKADSLAATLQRVMPFESETGLLNAEKFETVSEREWLRMQRQELPLTLVLIKLDHFEQFEQAYGRMVYEAVMRRLAEVFRKAGSRPGDVAARLDRDLFVILFPEAEERYALLLAEALRVRVCHLATPNRHAPQGLQTASFGVATTVPHPETSLRALRERAEAALYEAVFQGGNRSVRNRMTGFARLERWNTDNDGLVTLDNLSRKLALSGYHGKPRELKPGATIRERRVNRDTVEAVVTGVLKITLDGEIRTLRSGDCLYLPKGILAHEEVLGADPVICIEGVRA
ncbi:MAG: diguanylate cyclase domain-containing protein, partial [Gammaproteobacteria bacterium]